MCLRKNNFIKQCSTSDAMIENLRGGHVEITLKQRKT